MGILDFFKKKKQIVENEKISRDEFQDWLLNKKEKIENQEKDFSVIVKKKILQLTSELNEEISVLRKVNIEEKKVEERIKSIVKKNLNNYISHLERLIVKLKKIDDEKEIISEINFIFTEFQKESAINYAKTTILIGKEMVDVKESLKKFFKDTEDLLKDHKNVIDESKIIRSVEIDAKKFNEIKKIKSEIAKDIEECNSNINNLKELIKIKEEEIENVKKSEKFLEESKKEQDLKIKKQELEKDVENLSRIIDFKALTNFYHSFEKEMNTIKEYKEDFKKAFQKKKGEEIILLLRESKLNDVNILDKIQEIEEKEKEINNITLEETGLKSLENAVNKIKLEIETFSSEKIMKEKRIEKLEINLEEITKSIKIKLAKINVELNF